MALARRAGATVAEGTPLLDARHEAGAVVVELGAGTGSVRARTVVGADGMWSLLRRALGVAEPGYRGEWHAFRQYLRGVSPRAARELVVWFEPDLLPGYAWSFPLAGGVANVGFGILRGAGYEVGAMAAIWRDLRRRPHVRAFLGPDARPEGPHRAWPIPAHVERSTLAAGRALFVGDAATAADPMTGEGIGQALATGSWAAEAVLAGGDDPDAVAAAYRRRVSVPGSPATTASRDGWAACCAPRSAPAPRCGRPAPRTGHVRNFARWLFEDYPRALVLTPDRWHRGALHGPGAYGGHPCAPV